MNRQFFSALLRRRALLIVAAVVAVCVVAAAVLLWRGLSLGAPQTRAPHPVDSPSISTTPTLTPVPSLPAEAEDVIDAPASTIVAAVTGKSVAIHESPGGVVVGTLPNPQPSGAPLVFRVVAQQGSWVQVMLAQRPNGSTGWIPASAVSLSTDPYAIVVTVATNTLDLYKDGKLLHSYPVATGTGGTPTPKGRFALTELLKPTNSGYGPYAYGTTAFSDVLNSFGGGPGQIGLHGTDDTSSIGTAASHGCVRMHNDDITALAKILPLGTPFQVR